MLQKIVFSLGLFLFILSCGRSNEKDTKSLDTSSTQSIKQKIDTTFVVITSDDNPNATGLSLAEIIEVNNIFLQCISDNRKHLLASNKYLRQYFPYYNEKGEKEVRVNCFCSAMGLDWKKSEIRIEDGGNCFFSFYIRLDTKKYFDLIINGEA